MILIAGLLVIPLFAVYLLVYDRQSQSETARTSIAEGWGGPQTIAGPILVLPYQEPVAYVVAAAAIIGLLAAYSAAVLKSWRRGGYVAALLNALYGVLHVLLSLEAYSLLIGALLLFAALAGVMYLTRRLDWSGGIRTPVP